MTTIAVSGLMMTSDVQASTVKTFDNAATTGIINEEVLQKITRTNSVEVARVNTKFKLALNKTRVEQKREAERKAKEDAERKEAERKAKEEAEQKAKEEAERKAKAEAEAKRKAEEAKQQAKTQAQPVQQAPIETELQFGADGLLVMQSSGRAQQVVNLLLGIPGHSNGAGYHRSTGLDGLINQLSTSEAVWVLHRIEGAGFGQTGDGYAGGDSPASHTGDKSNQQTIRWKYPRTTSQLGYILLRRVLERRTAEYGTDT